MRGDNHLAVSFQMKVKAYCHLASNGNEVDVANLFPRFQIRLKKVAKLALFVLKNLRFRRISLSLVFVSDNAMKRLNKRYLNHPWVTDVIAFPFCAPLTLPPQGAADPPRILAETLSPEGRGEGEGGETLLGEVIISSKQAELYAKKNHIPVYQELERYICHGILHLKGYTDSSMRARQSMRKKEDELIKAFERKLGAAKVI